jgi:diaminopimelate decarboxylase
MDRLEPINGGSFHHVEQRLYCEQTAVEDIVAAIGTPVYIYSRGELMGRARAYLSAAAAHTRSCLVCFALKANGNPSLLSLLAEEGLGADVTSGGELFIAQRSGFSDRDIVFSGVGKSDEEIVAALHAGIRAIHVESAAELGAITQVAQSRQVTVPIAVRLNPDIVVDTHPHISTGAHGHKFGVGRNEAESLILQAQASPWLEPVGLGAHIGSQITDLAPFRQAAASLVELGRSLKARGIALRYIDVGGGLGIDYDGAGAPTPAELVEAVAPLVSDAGFDLILEPGRSIIGPSGILVSRVIYRKEQGRRPFVIVDAGMNDLLRPALYGAFHPIWPVKTHIGKGGRPPETGVYDVVGPVCETSDTFAVSRELPHTERGDLLAFMYAGAYGFAMSSNYNGRPRAAEVLVDGSRWSVIRQRQSYDDLISGCLAAQFIG